MPFLTFAAMQKPSIQLRCIQEPKEAYAQHICISEPSRDWLQVEDGWINEWLQALPKEEPGLWSVQKGKDTWYAWRLAKEAEEVRSAAPALKKDQGRVLVHPNRAEHILPALEGLGLKNYSYLRKEKLQIDVHGPNIAGLEHSEALIQSVWLARDWGNDPYNTLHAQEVHARLEQLAAEWDLHYEGLGPAALKSLNMQGLLSVNKGSATPPLFAVIEYRGSQAKNQKPLVLVGKGILFDTGGSSLKNPKGMEEMKADMCGGANVVATMVWAAKTKQPMHLVGLIPFTDNRLAPDSLVPGDVIRYSNGTTVEVLNTDAEGRLVLADALLYAKKYDPALVIDQATLTGSAVGTLGFEAMAGMHHQAQTFMNELKLAGDKVGEVVVELPMLQAYEDALNSEVADLKNIGGPYAGCITAGIFLKHFTDYPWIHLDLANSFRNSPKAYWTSGATGAGVRLLAQFISQWKAHE